MTIFSLAVIYFHLNLPPMPRALDHAALVEQIWPTIEPIMPRTPLGSDLSRARTKRFLEAILWLVDADGDWDSLPEDYGSEPQFISASTAGHARALGNAFSNYSTAKSAFRINMTANE